VACHTYCLWRTLPDDRIPAGEWHCEDCALLRGGPIAPTATGPAALAACGANDGRFALHGAAAALAGLGARRRGYAGARTRCGCARLRSCSWLCCAS
jgi:hypothetical protein